jgi:hypothetical protein
MSKRTKLIERLLQALREKAPLSTNKGKFISTPHYISRKDKRHSGWVTPGFPKNPGMKYQEAVANAMEPQDFYDDWKDWRDGQRNYFKDASHFKKGMSKKKFDSPYMKEWMKPEHVNKKLRKELYIRRASKLKRTENISNEQ